jgi:polysaccharide export outer membrane protein
MFKTPRDYPFAQDTSSIQQGPYIIQSDDKIDLHIFSNDGFKLIDITQSSISQTAYNEGLQYIVEENGEAKMPVIGRVTLKGLSIKEAENMLQEKYAKYYKDPFVLLRVTSRHALVFLGDGGRGVVVQLQNDHTSLFEALALAGGLSEYSKAFQIRIIRGDYKNPKVFKADISSMEGLKHSELQIYPNDIIYIDASQNFSRRLNSEFLPYISLLTSFLVLLAYINK